MQPRRTRSDGALFGWRALRQTGQLRIDPAVESGARRPGSASRAQPGGEVLADLRRCLGEEAREAQLDGRFEDEEGGVAFARRLVEENLP